MERKNILGSVGHSITRFFGRKGKSVVLAPPHLNSAARFPYGPFQFKFKVPKGTGYEIHCSTNLRVWEPILSGRSSGEPVDYDRLERTPAVIRRGRAPAPSGPPSPGFDPSDIPAFLRKQAD